jgi:hypothetical protein
MSTPATSTTTFIMRRLRILLLITLLIAMSTFALPNAAAMPDETLQGEIWSDINCDGIRQENEPLFAGMTVYLFAAGADGQIHTADDQLIEQSGSLGTMLFRLGITDLDYALNVVPRARPFGYVPSPLNVGADRTIDNDLRRDWSTAGFRFSETETVSDIDLGLCANPNLSTTYLPLLVR